MRREKERKRKWETFDAVYFRQIEAIDRQTGKDELWSIINGTMSMSRGIQVIGSVTESNKQV